MNGSGRFDHRQKPGMQPQLRAPQPKGSLPIAARPIQAKPQGVAPAPYRPQPVPRVLQAKMHCHQGTCQPNRAPVTPTVYRPQPVPKVLQTKMAVKQMPRATGQSPRQAVAPPVYRPEAKKIVQPKVNAVTQPQRISGAGLNTHRPAVTATIQRQITIQGGRNKGVHKTKGGKSTKELIAELERDARSDNWKRGWKLWVSLKAQMKANEDYADVDALADAVDAAFQQAPRTNTRPSFPSAVYSLAKGVHAINTGTLDPNLSLADEDMAVPHRLPYADIRNNVNLFKDGKETETDLERWSDRPIEATKKRKRLSEGSSNAKFLPNNYGKKVDEQIDQVVTKRKKLIDAKKKGLTAEQEQFAQELIAALNAIHGNVPDLGPHSTVNIPVSNRGHMNIQSDGTMSPGTEELLCMSPHRLEKGIATTSDNTHIVTTYGSAVPILTLPQSVLDKLNKHKLSKTTLDQSDLK